jgi:hypothetical protein
MTSYNFKEIAPIPEAGQLVDIVLSKTNRKTPTVVSIIFPGYGCVASAILLKSVNLFLGPSEFQDH